MTYTLAWLGPSLVVLPLMGRYKVPWVILVSSLSVPYISNPATIFQSYEIYQNGQML
jgi:hypothetical protein